MGEQLSHFIDILQARAALFEINDEFIAEATNKGWDLSVINGKNGRSLVDLLDKQDSIIAITEDYILIRKANGIQQYFEKDIFESKDRFTYRE